MARDDILTENEQLIFDVRPHWIALVGPVIESIVAIAIAVFFQTKFNGTSVEVVWILAALAVLVLGFIPLVRWNFTRFLLTSDRIITRRGVIAKHSKEIPLERINDVTFNQSILERMVGAGDITLESAGEHGQEVIGHVRKPAEVHREIYRQTEANQQRMSGGGAAQQTAPQQDRSIPAQIEALKKLADSGAISETEFQMKKQELLKRM